MQSTCLGVGCTDTLRFFYCVIAEVVMDAEVESVMASSQDQREEELQVNTKSTYSLACVAVSTFPSGKS